MMAVLRKSDDQAYVLFGPKPDPIIDLGCGTGLFLYNLNRAYNRFSRLGAEFE
jgi:hypothetical protein